MALALIVEKIDTVPEALRGEYVEKEGKFHLNVEGLEDTAGLKSALQKERDAVKASKTEIAAWKKLGKTPDEIAEMVAAKEKETEDALKKSGNVDAILKGHQEKSAEILKQTQTAAAAKQAELEAELNASRTSERNAIIETAVTGALTKAKATPEGLDLLTERLGKRITFEMQDGKRRIQIMKADGVTPMAGSGAEGAATYDDLVKEAQKTWPSLFEGSGAGGSGTDPKSLRRDASGKVMTRKDFDALSPTDKHAKMKAGFTLVD